MINSVVLVGRLGNDPELTYTPDGTAICKFRLAVDRPPRRESTDKQTDWLDVVAFGKVGENTAQYMRKGSLVGIEGRVQSRTWEGQDGKKRYAVEINANRVQFLESRRERDGQGAQGPPPQRPQQQRPPQAPTQAAPPSGDAWAADEDEDPFGDQ